MKKVISMIFAFCILVSCLVMGGCSLPGCSGSEVKQQQSHLVVVYAACQNNPTPNAAGQLYDTIHGLASKWGSTFSLVVADGDPYQAYSRTFSEPGVMLSNSKLEGITAAYTGEALNALGTACAVTPEVDLLSALNLASRQLRSYGDDGMAKEIIIIASGLTTTGPLDFTYNLLAESPETIVRILKEGDYLADLSCVDRITWLHLGDTELPQKSLFPSNVVSLKNIWSAVLEASGATDVFFAPDLPGEVNEDNSLPDVKEVSVIGNSAVDPVESILDAPISLDADRVCFRYDTAEFSVPIENVHEVIKPYVDFLVNNPHEKLIVAGTASAQGEADYNRRLSLQRAKAITKEFVSLGADPDQIISVGLGYSSHPFRAYITDANGNPTDTEDHAKNMAAVIVSYDIEEAKMLLEIGLVGQ